MISQILFSLNPDSWKTITGKEVKATEEKTLCFNKYFFVVKITTLPDTGILRCLQADRQQFGHQDEVVYVWQRLKLVQVFDQD